MNLIEPLSRNLSKLVLAAADAYAATGMTGRSPSPIPCAPRADPSVSPRASPRRRRPGWRQRSMPCRRTNSPQPLRASAPEIPWIIGGDKMPASFAGRSAYNEIVGPDGFAASDSLRFGLYVQAPESFYPPHNHAAEEFYYVLSGTARWQKGEEALSLKPPGSCIRHAPWQRHAMETMAEPLLALWVWTGDLDMASYRMEGA